MTAALSPPRDPPTRRACATPPRQARRPSSPRQHRSCKTPARRARTPPKPELPAPACFPLRRAGREPLWIPRGLWKVTLSWAAPQRPCTAQQSHGPAPLHQCSCTGHTVRNVLVQPPETQCSRALGQKGPVLTVVPLSLRAGRTGDCCWLICCFAI